MASRSAPSELDAGARDRLARQGVLHLPGVLDARQLEAMHAAWDRLASGDRNIEVKALQDEPAFAPCPADPRVLAAVGALLGPGFRLMEMHGRAPPKGHGRQGLHIDWHSPVEPDDQIIANAFFALDDMDAGNGATRLVPGSHRLRQGPRGTWTQPHGRHPDEQVVSARAGDCIVFSAHVWHSGTDNASGARRRVVIAQFARPDLQIPGFDPLS